MSQIPMTRKQRIYNTLSLALKPDILLIEDESSQHRKTGATETHFKVIMTTSRFEHLGRIDRHRLLNELLADELKNGLHALSLRLYTPAEWIKQSGSIPLSPPCQHRT